MHRTRARIRTINSISTLALAGPILLLAATANAQGTAEQQSACMRDAFQFCSAYIPSAARVGACLEINKNKISPACRAQFEDSEPKPRRVRRVKSADRDQ
jgi:hypothetical protein